MVLTIAAGSSNRWLADQGFTVSAVDTATGATGQAEDHQTPITFLQGRIDTFAPAPESKYDALVVLGHLHFLPLDRLSRLIDQLQRHTHLGGYHIIRASGLHAPRAGEPTKTELIPWLDWYADWRIIELAYRENEVASRNVESPRWLFDHNTLLIAKKEPSAERQQALARIEK